VPDHVSKRAFLAGLTCRTRGWREHRAARGEIGPGLEWQFHIGQSVGRLAREQLGAGIGLPFGPTETALEATRAKLLDPLSGLLYEPTFVWGGAVARADALRRNGEGWDLIEVKSGKEPEDGKPSEDYIDDAAFTAMVAQGAGLRIERCILMLIRREYRLGDGLPVLVELDATEEVLARAEQMSALAPALPGAILAAEMPAASLIFECRDCGYFEKQCLGAGVTDPIFLIPRLSRKKFESLGRCLRVSSLPDGVDLTDAQARVVRVLRSGQPEVDPIGLSRLDRIEWPARYLDFEAVAPALPWFPGAGSYETMPFQYSMHIADQPGSVRDHREYLAELGTDWRRELAVRLLADLGERGSIVSYSGYEKSILRYLGEIFPELQKSFDAAIARLFDLELVVKEGYCHPGFRGRTSIKKVLPVMTSDLSYKDLSVSDGRDAAGVFGLMWVGERSTAESASIREALLAYCKLDTQAMVLVHHELWKVRQAA